MNDTNSNNARSEVDEEDAELSLNGIFVNGVEASLPQSLDPRGQVFKSQFK